MRTSIEPTEHQAVTSQEWMRLPSKGRDPVFGLSRPWYYDAIKKGLIRSASLRRKGALTGVRLVNVASVRAYIERNIVSFDPCEQ